MANTVPPPIPTDQSSKPPQGAGLMDYLKAAFFFRWNVLFFLGGLVAAAIAPLPDVTIPIVLAGELAYLGALTSIPRFRAAIDARVHSSQGTTSAQPTTAPSLVVMLAGLPGEARKRFEQLHARCVEMRQLAIGVRGASGRDADSAEEIRTPGLDRLLWLFLRLLMSKNALDRFLQTMSSGEVSAQLEQLRKDFAAAQQGSDERIARSLQDSIAMAELRLDNYERAKKNAQFVSIELDRMESKIQALAEMAVNRQDPDLISSQVDSAAESMRQTEKAVSELQHLTGLADELLDPPSILDADLRQVLRQ